MDDEEVVRDFVRMTLSDAGYDVETAVDGAEAIHVYEEGRRAGRPFDAVIMDLTIPGGMGGKEAIASLRTLDPNVAAIVSSGYCNDPILADHVKHGFVARIAKPYQPEDLLDLLHRVVEGHRDT